MIVAEGISKSFGNVQAVNNISFTIRDGEITGLLGPNGAGKTTTLRMLTCFLKSESGTIRVGNYDVDKNPVEVRSIIGYLPESAPEYSDMLVYDYLDFVADIRGIEDKARIAEIGKVCGITEVMHKSISELSKGYKQRVGLANSMIHDPDILILDEPTSGLDPNQIIEIRNLIKEIGKKKTVILSTHILPEVEATCDRVIIIDQGNIVADDRTENLHISAGGGAHIIVSVQGTDYPTLSSALSELEGVKGVDQVQDDDLVTARITQAGERDIRPDIFHCIKNKDWILFEMTRERMDLEKIFRDLTMGGDHG